MSFFLYPRLTQTDLWRVRFEGEFYLQTLQKPRPTLDGIMFISMG